MNQPPIPNYSTGGPKINQLTSQSHIDSPILAERPLVHRSNEDIRGYHSNEHQLSTPGTRRALEESKMQPTSLQDLWQEQTRDWDLETRVVLNPALSTSTLNSYNGMLSRFQRFCNQENLPIFG